MKRLRLTMWDLVESVQDTARSDAEAVAVLAHLLKTRRIRPANKMARRRIEAALAA